MRFQASHLLPPELPRLLLLLGPLRLLLQLRLLVAEADLLSARGCPAGRQHAERVPEQALHLLPVRRQCLWQRTAYSDPLSYTSARPAWGVAGYDPHQLQNHGPRTPSNPEEPHE